MKIAVCPGSFDPVTNGHVDIIRRAAKLFDKVIVLVSVNADKHPVFTADERVFLIESSVKDLENVSVESFGGLLADYVRKCGASVILKGLRAVSDFEYEFQMALANKKLCPSAETVFLTSGSEYMYLSSSVVKQIASFGGDITDFVPECTIDFIKNRLERTGNK